MTVIPLSALDLSIAVALVLALAAVNARLGFGQGRAIALAVVRTMLQLLLIGFVLRALFRFPYPGWIALMSLVMLAAAGREVMTRQKHRFSGWWGYGVGTVSMFVSSFAVTVFALMTLVRPDPWFTPQYTIPLLGMVLGNTMNGISLGVDRLTLGAVQQRTVLEQRLLLGHSGREAIGDILKDSIRTGLIPILNAMAAAGLVSLPGMMTGQILAGGSPFEAAKYQILIMLLIAAGTGFGLMLAAWLGSRRLFDERDRLRLDRLCKR
jgi:putative ABC transport system permease protein